MLPASGQKRLKEHIYSAGGVDVLKMGAIYGANGAGKSNLVKAMQVMNDIVVSKVFSGIMKFKLDKAALNMPTTFEVEFSLNDKLYSYGISVDTNTILEEWLYETGLKEDRLVFSRTTKNGMTNIIMSNEYFNTPEDHIRMRIYENDLLKDNDCLLTMIANSKDPIEEIKQCFMHFLNISNCVFPYTRATGLIPLFLKDPTLREFINQNICSSNTGISQIEIRKDNFNTFFGTNDRELVSRIKERVSVDKDAVFYLDSGEIAHANMDGSDWIVNRLVTTHLTSDSVPIDFFLSEESDGTNRLLELMGAFYSTLIFPITIIVDEIDQSIHVNLLKELISKFSKDNNTKGQLIFTTHESNLLDQDILRQDEIWFAEKSPAGETGFYPLSDYEIRSDLDIRKGYLNGRFGAVPFLANLHDLNWDKYGKDEA